MHFFDIDWRTLFGLSLPLTEIAVRGSVFYWFLFFLFRFIVRRDVGSIGIADILIIVIVVDASQNALAGEYHSITDGMVLVSTLIFWNVALDWLSFRFPAIRRFAEPPPLVLIKDGRFNYRNMRRELITENELWSLLREKEVESIEQVKRAFLEADGQISVIKNQA